MAIEGEGAAAVIQNHVHRLLLRTDQNLSGVVATHEDVRDRHACNFRSRLSSRRLLRLAFNHVRASFGISAARRSLAYAT